MVERRARWINTAAGLVGGVFLVLGVLGLAGGITLRDTFLAVLGFLIAGWAVLDFRRYRSGTPESEVDGGHTIE